MDPQSNDDDSDFRPVKRFKHQSYKSSLKEVHLPSPLSQSNVDRDLADNDSHFHEALDHWRQLNLSPAFLRFANQADPLSSSMPLLLHNWREIIDLWIAALDASDDEALRALLDLLQKLAHDLRTTIAPAYPNLLHCLLNLLLRSISAPSLTALLSTLSALFRYLLIPSISSNNGFPLLEETWTSIRNTLAKCDSSEMQRAVGEVWGSVLRRLKTDSARERAVELVVADLTGIEDVCAWVFVSACKSVAQTLHTSTPSLIAPLLNYNISCDSNTSYTYTYTLIRRTLTALIHHCKSAEQFTALGDLLVTRFCDVVKAAKDSDKDQAEHTDEDEGGEIREHLRRTLEIISVPCSVRQGSRMSQKQLATLTSEFPSISSPLNNAYARIQGYQPALLKATTSLFTAGDMALWLSAPVRAILAQSWDAPEYGISLHGALSDAGYAWGGWKMVGMPSVVRAVVGGRGKLLVDQPRSAGRFLAGLARAGEVAEGDVVWRRRVEEWVEGRLERWKKSADEVEELSDLLELVDLVPAISVHLVKIINSTLETPEPKADYEETYANSAWILGSCMQALAKRASGEWEKEADLASWARTSIERWGWSDVVLGGVVALVRTSSDSSDEKLLSLSDIYPLLQDSILSHSRPLRLNTLRLLASPKLVKCPSGEREVLKRCLQGEEVQLDVQGVRERVLRIGRVAQIVREGDVIAADICARWLLAQLKVNLRPLWSPAAEALASLSQHFGDLVWELIFGELRAVSQATEKATTTIPHWMKGVSSALEDDDDKEPLEEERSWRDPSAHKLRSAIGKWLRNDHQRMAVIRDQILKERLDHTSYESQLLSALGECSSLTEKHNRDLVPFFLSFAGPESSSKLPRFKLNAWLTLFSKFTNPKALHSTDMLHALYLSLLSHADRSLQRLSLACVLAYKSPHLAPHADRLNALIDDTRWREELTALDIAKIEPQDRRDLVDVIIRLLFGMMLEKRGRTRGTDRRSAVLSTLGGCSDLELELLVDLMLRPMGSDSTSRREKTSALRPIPSGISEKQQVGFLTLLGDVLKNLGPRLILCWPALLGTTIDLIGHSQGRIEAAQSVDSVEEPEDGEADELEDIDNLSSSKITRAVRQLGLKRFADFFRNPTPFDITSYMETSFRAFISPRLPSLDKENTQAPSALLELFYSWTLVREHVRFLVDFDSRTLPQVYACLIATNVKPAVVSRIFDLVDRVLAFSTTDDFIATHVVQPHVSLLLSNLAILVERTKGVATVSSTLGQRQIAILSEIAQYLTDASQAATLLDLFSPLLRKPSKLVPEKVKVNLLKIISNLLPLISELSDQRTSIFSKTHDLLARLFQSLRSSPARITLVATFHRFAKINSSLVPLANLLESLNAYSTKRIDEPDFDCRLEAFAKLNDTLYASLTTQDWLPVLYNMLSFIQDADELVVRSNASYTLKHFIDLVAGTLNSEYESLFMRVLYPGLKNGLRSKNELVRAEVLGVLAYAVTKCDKISFLQEMRILLAGGDEEANFFNNIHHVQVHRRTRALRRLADQCDEGHLRSTTLADIFVPLVSNYIITTASLDHHLVNEAIVATGHMAKQLTWGAYYALVQKYLKSSRDRDESERVYVRTLVAILENFHFPMEETVPSQILDPDDNTVVDADDYEDHHEELSIAAEASVRPLADTGKIADAVSLRLLPNLLHHLEKRDITEDSLRIPISIGIVKVARHLPKASREPQIARLLTILSQILRSKSQETRDLTRETLCRIAVILGPSYLPVMLRELRAALLRGPQLHVLAYVVHALLAYVTTAEYVESFQILDECVADVAHVSAEVVFGESGKDVQSEDFKTKMREVRSSSAKGLDSFAILAKHITPSNISGLLFPVRAIMRETQFAKTIQLVEEVLRRITGGLNVNKHLSPPELLVLCHTLISQNARFLKDAPSSQKQKKDVKGAAIVQLKRHTLTDADHYGNNAFRFVVFGLDLFNTAFRRSRFDFRDTAIIARLESMVPVIGNTLYSSNTPVITSGMKAAAAITKSPLKSLDKSLPVFIRQILDIVRQTGTTESDAVQTAFKSLATILRDCPIAQVKEKDLVYLLELLSPDLEEPSRQASVFAMLRAIVSRKFVVPEIYDLMDKVSEIMVTNQSTQVQELCRSVLLQFLLDYPQGKGRLRNQMTFMAKNLSFVYETGRKSVMELLDAIVSKFEVALVREYADLLFVGLVLVIANDDSAKCREMAAELIKRLVSRLDDHHRRLIMSHLHSWAAQQSQPQLARVSSQVYGIIVDTLQCDASPHISAVLEDVNAALDHSKQKLESTSDSDEPEEMEVEVEWQMPYHALIVISKVLRVFPDITLQSDKINWSNIIAHLLFPHAWVRMASCRLVGLLFAAVPIVAPRPDLPGTSPFSLLGMRGIAQKLSLQLKSEHLDVSLSTQVVKNLLYIGKCFCAVPVGATQEDVGEDDIINGEDGDMGKNSEDNTEQNPLPWLFSKLSYQVRSAHMGRRNRSFSATNWWNQPLSILRWFAAMASYMEAHRLKTFLVHVLSPVYRIIEDDTIRDPQMDEIKTLAVELQDLIQTKVGTTTFANAYSRIRQSVLSVRRDRKTARIMQVATNPEAAAKRKLQRNAVKKDSRKRKNKSFADNKGRIKRRREE